MPSKASELLEQLRASNANWKRPDMERLYEGFGFIIETGHGRHGDKVWHPDFPILISSLPRHNRVHVYLVVQAVKLIDRLERLRKEQEGKT